MTADLWVFLATSILLILFASFLFWTSLTTIRTSYREQVQSLREDKKALHTLLKDAQNRIHAASLNDYLTLQAHNGGTEIVDGPPPFGSMSRSDAVEAEIASRMMPTAEVE